SGLDSESGKYGCCRICGCQSGFASTSGRILGALRPCVCEFLVAAGQYLCSPPQLLVLHLWDSPRHQVILQCWYVKDEYVLDRWCSPVHQKVAQH
ncbi:unnamed protein product, partial [Staurois parvus]